MLVIETILGAIYVEMMVTVVVAKGTIVEVGSGWDTLAVVRLAIVSAHGLGTTMVFLFKKGKLVC